MTAAGVAGAVTVTDADAPMVVSACEMAVTATVAGIGTVLGAVYKPVVEMKPTVEVPPVTAFTCQVTAVFVVFATVAVNCWVALVTTDAEVGERVTVTPVVVEEELLLPPQAVKTAKTAHTTTPVMTRFIYDSWLRLNDCRCPATKLLGIICVGRVQFKRATPLRSAIMQHKPELPP
jgi:hypothetical protein